MGPPRITSPNQTETRRWKMNIRFEFDSNGDEVFVVVKGDEVVAIFNNLHDARNFVLAND
jgi:hypothetical protein